MATIKVRIAVAVSSENWCASGWSGAGDETLMHDAIGWLDGQEIIGTYWLTAELPIPEPQTIEATVEVMP